MDYGKASLAVHRRLHGKIETSVRADVSNAHALSLAYSPGVAEPCLAIQRDPSQSFELTRRWNTVAPTALPCSGSVTSAPRRACR